MIQQPYHSHAGNIMGGPWKLRHVPVSGIDPERVVAAALGALTLVDRQMSTYRHDSDLMRLNAAPVGDWVTVSPDVVSVIAEAQRIAEMTANALDICVGSAVNAWGFGPCPVPRTAPATGPSKPQGFALHPTRPAVLKSDDVTLDLCALAKGFAVDKAAAAVAALGVESFMIEAAGEIYAQGRRADGSHWAVGLELPIPDKHLLGGAVPLDRMAVATSGNYRNLRHVGGKRVGHTIDPATGAPLEGDLLSVTILHPCCMTADALATALFVMGASAAPTFAQLHNLAARFVTKAEDGMLEISSEAFMDHMRIAVNDPELKSPASCQMPL